MSFISDTINFPTYQALQHDRRHGVVSGNTQGPQDTNDEQEFLFAGHCPGVGVLVSAGCGRNPLNTAAVSGHVTYYGKPVTEGRITFYPEEGRAATGASVPTAAIN